MGQDHSLLLSADAPCRAADSGTRWRNRISTGCKKPAGSRVVSGEGRRDAVAAVESLRDAGLDEQLLAAYPGLGRLPTSTRLGRRRGVRATAAIAAAILLVAFAVGLAVGRFVDPNEPVGHPGFENPGQPFYGVGLRCMTPPEAHRAILERGFEVAWQIEDRDAHGIGTTTISSEPPPVGVVEGGFVEDGTAHVVVSVGSGAVPYPGCH